MDRRERESMEDSRDQITDLYDRNRAYYDRNSDRYEAASWYYFNRYKSRSVTRELRRCLRELGNLPELRVLEVGPGTGYLLEKLLAVEKRPIAYTGVEHSARMGEILAVRYGKLVKQFRVIPDSVTVEAIDTAVGNESFDLIIGSSILHHLIDYDRIVLTLSALLADGGVMYFVREPIHRRECREGSVITDVLSQVYGLINNQLMRRGIRDLLWPKKVKAEDASAIAYHMYRDGISMDVFDEMRHAGYSLLFTRRYNRRVSTAMSYLENKLLSRWRKDVYGDTLFSIAIKRTVLRAT